MSSTILTALRASLADEPGRPLVTFYDDATGERIELSVVTFINWVDKIANLLTDELMLDAGDVVRVDLPTHWQSTVAMVGAWTSGLTVGLGVPSDHVALNIVGPDARDQPERLAGGMVLGCSLRPMGGPFTEELPPGWLDFAREVPPQPDALISPVDVVATDVALSVADAPTIHGDLFEQAVRTAEEIGLAPGGRLITDANPSRPSGLNIGLLGPIAVGASVVLVAHADAARRAAVGEQERASARCWLSG